MTWSGSVGPAASEPPNDCTNGPNSATDPTRRSRTPSRYLLAMSQVRSRSNFVVMNDFAG